MSPRQIDLFFRALARELDLRASVILTGAAAGALWGHVRPSLDIDFAIRPARGRARDWDAIERAVARATQRTGISVNYAEDIDRWGVISLLDYARHTRPYRRFGSLDVRLLDPAYWSVGKISRYLEPDVQDVAGVFTRQRVAMRRVLAVWAKALRASPRSTASTLFRQQAEHFLQTYGAKIWGRSFDAGNAVRQFERLLAR